jgi:hypothetical protein
MSDDTHLVDPRRSADLDDVGQRAYYAATAVEADGAEHLVLVQRAGAGDPTIRYCSQCPDVEHEQTGPLPIEIVRRITITSRNQPTERNDQ